MNYRNSAFIATIVLAGNALAQTGAGGVITLIGSGGGLFTYDITLTNTGSTGIQTFWFAWDDGIPDENNMPDMPSNLVNPSGWTSIITSGNPGYGIQWVTNGGLAAGDSLPGFEFTSPDSLSVLEGMVMGEPIMTSFVYEGQPFDGGSYQFVVSPSPEPSSALVLAGLSAAAFLVRRKALAPSQ